MKTKNAETTSPVDPVDPHCYRAMWPDRIAEAARIGLLRGALTGLQWGAEQDTVDRIQKVLDQFDVR